MQQARLGPAPPQFLQPVADLIRPEPLETHEGLVQVLDVDAIDLADRLD